MADLIQLRRDKLSVWNSVNPTLGLGEVGLVQAEGTGSSLTNPLQFKVGDGVTAWTSLPLQNASAINTIKVNGVELTISGDRAVDVVVKASGSLGANVGNNHIAFLDANGVLKDSSITVASTSGSSTSSLMHQKAVTDLVSSSTSNVQKNLDNFEESVSGSLAQLSGSIDFIEENFARIDGSYDSMAVGVAKNLEGNQEVEGAFISRTAGGDAEIANGVAQITEVRGNSQVWNQLVQNGDFSDGTTGWSIDGDATYTIRDNTLKVTRGSATSNIVFSSALPGIQGHKYYGAADMKANSSSVYVRFAPLDLHHSGSGEWERLSGIFTRTGSSINPQVRDTRASDWDEIQITNIIVIDLTLLGIDNLTTVEEVEAWLAENIGPSSYYPYNAGTVLNNSMEGIETIGFNLLDPATGKAQIIGAYDDLYDNLYGITGTHGTITFTAADGTVETITPDADGKFQLTVPGELSVADAGADCAVFLWWDGTKTDYEEYDRNVSYLDVEHIYGRLNGSGSLVQVFPNGMAGIGDVKDVLRNEDGVAVARKRMVQVDMGTLDWVYDSTYQYFRNYQETVNSVNFILAKYVNSGLNTSISNMSSALDKSAYYRSANNRLLIKDTAYTDPATFKTAMSGVMLYYELATPQHYTDLVYINSSHFADNTAVTLPVTYTVDNWGIENILPKNTSESVSTAPADLTCVYAMDAVEMINTHSDQIEDLYEVKADKEGVYPNIVAGNLVDVNSVGAEQQFIFRKTGGDEHVADKTQAVLQKYMGNSLVWNQLFNGTLNGNATNITALGQNRFSATLIGGTSYYQQAFYFNVSILAGHKYYAKLLLNGAQQKFRYYNGSTVVQADVTNAIFSATHVGTRVTFGENVVEDTDVVVVVHFFDLTLMFGSGNEPSTVEEFEALFPLPYYAYNAGEIISNKTEQVKVVGFNQWDEVAEVGSIDATTGANDNSVSNRLRSKNSIRVIPLTTYYFRNPVFYAGNNVAMRYYDADGNYIGSYDADNTIVGIGNKTFKTPAGCHLVRFVLPVAYGTTYNNDICINISDAAKNGTYEPYQKSTIQIGLGEFQVRDSEGNVTTVNGLKSAGSVYDEIDPVRKKYIKRIGVVDMGTLTWNASWYTEGANWRIYVPVVNKRNGLSNIACSAYSLANVADGVMSDITITGNSLSNIVYIKDSRFSASGSSALIATLTGKKLNYELDEPVEYDLVGSIPETYLAFGTGTEAIQPDGVDEETGVPLTAPFRAIIAYSKDYLGQLNSMPEDYISVGSMTNFYTELAAKLGAAISKSISVSASFNSSDQKYDYVITISDISGSV